MEADKKARLVVQKAILTALLIAGCVTCLLLVLPVGRL